MSTCSLFNTIKDCLFAEKDTLNSMSEVAKNSGINPLQYIRGIPFTYAPRFSRENIEAAFDYVARDGDIAISSYPKTGTTLLEYTVLQIMSNGEFFPNMNDLMHKIVPFIEMTGTSAIEVLNQRRIYKHHLPFNVIKKNDKAKYLYIYRKPEDTLVSYYHFTQNVILSNEKIQMGQYFEDFLSGDVAYGSYFKHVSSYISHKEDDNLFITTYENLVSNRREEILKIAKFLGDEYHRSVAGDESVLNAIMEHTSFHYMKSRLWYDNPDSDNKRTDKTKKVDFFRKGVVGEGRQVLSSVQLKRLRDVALQEIESKHVIDEWTK